MMIIKVENRLRLLTEVNEHIGPVSTLYSTKQVDLHTWQQIHTFANYILFQLSDWFMFADSTVGVTR